METKTEILYSPFGPYHSYSIVESVAADTYTAAELSDMTKAEIVALAAEQGISLNAGVLKADLIAEFLDATQGGTE